MDRRIIAVVLLVGIVGAVAGGSLVFFYMKTHPPAYQDALALGATPPSVTKRLTTKNVEPPLPPVRSVDPATVPLEGFTLGQTEAAAAKHGDELKLKFTKTPDKIDKSRVFWNYVPAAQDARYRSIRLLVVNGVVAGVRVKYQILQPERVSLWDEALGQPYRNDSGEKHWKMVSFKAKATINGEKFYEVVTDYRDFFEW